MGGGVFRGVSSVGPADRRDPPQHGFAAPPSDEGGVPQSGGGGGRHKILHGGTWVRGKEAIRVCSSCRGEYRDLYRILWDVSPSPNSP